MKDSPSFYLSACISTKPLDKTENSDYR